MYKIEIEKAFEIFNILNAIPKLTIHLLAGMRASLFYSNVGLNYSAEFILRDNLYAVSIPNEPVRLSNPKHNLVTYTKDTVEFLNPATGVSKLPDEVQAAKNDTMKFSVRLERIGRFIQSPTAINFSDFTLEDGKSLGILINEINNE